MPQMWVRQGESLRHTMPPMAPGSQATRLLLADDDPKLRQFLELELGEEGYAVQIVPSGAVEAKVFLTNADVGFVRPDMAAQVRVDAYPFTQFGDIPGVLKSVGEEVLPADAQNPQPRFPALVMLKRQYLERNGNRYEIRPGQSVSVNLIVRNKPVISLLTDAVEKAWDSLRGIKSD